MHEQTLTLVIKPAEASHLDVLEHEFSPETLSKLHYNRYEVQKRGEGVYLIAWHEHTPVGHFLLRWSGPDDERIRKYMDVTNTAYLEGSRSNTAGLSEKGCSDGINSRSRTAAPPLRPTE